MKPKQVTVEVEMALVRASQDLIQVGAVAGAVVTPFFFMAFLTPYVAKWFWGIDYRGKK